MWWLVRLVGQLGYLGVALAVIGLVAYFLGYPYLQEVQGSDSFYHLSNISWFSRSFPTLYYWYPLQNGGVVPVWGYPTLSYLVVIIMERLTDWTLVGSYQLLGWLSVPLTAAGLYAFVWARLKNQTMALLAAGLYILMPMTWVWLFDWGFYTESVSYVFVFPILLVWDVFIVSLLKGRVGRRERLAGVGAVLGMALLFLTHPASFFVTGVMGTGLGLVQALGTGTMSRKRRVGLGVAASAAWGIVTICLLGFIFFDFFAYANVAPTTAAEGDKAVFLEAYATPVGSLLGLEKIPPTEFKYGHRNIVVPPVVWVGAIVGLVLSLVYSRKVLVFGLLAAMPVAFFHWPQLAWIVLHRVPFSGYVVSHRTILLFLRFGAPLAAAFGYWMLFRAAIEICTFWLKHKTVRRVRQGVIAVVAGVGSLLLVGYLVVFFANKPTSLWDNTQVRYGPQVFDIRHPFGGSEQRDVCALLQVEDPGRPPACQLEYVRNYIDVEAFLAACGQLDPLPKICETMAAGTVTQDEVESMVQRCQQGEEDALCSFVKVVHWRQVVAMFLRREAWPRPNLQAQIEVAETRFSPFIAAHKDEENLRIDVSPYLGGVVQTLNLESDISQINLYAITLSLLEPFWGYEQQVFFSENTGNTLNVNNLAQWFGIKYLFLEDKLDYLPKYEADSDHWQKVDEAGVWQFSEPTELYSWTVDKPTVLVIGSEEKVAFEPVFRTAVAGGYNYEEGWLVQGSGRVDDYSLEELEHFDTVVLYGYDYAQRRQAQALMDQYVRGGGNLLISTGWQYVDADWELAMTPDFFPVMDLTWSTEFEPTSRYELSGPEFARGVEIENFDPLSWQGQAWGVSVPTKGLRDWAKPVLSVAGVPVVAAGEYGEGKVVWMGFNVLGHINTYDDNVAETLFFGNLLRWFGTGNLAEETERSARVQMERPNPDLVTFTFTQAEPEPSTFYWREAVFANWRARVIRGGQAEKVEVYSAGPRFMLLQLPPLAQGDRLELAFKPGGRTYLGRGLSLVAIMGLILYLVKGGNGVKRLTKGLRQPMERLGKKMSALQDSFMDEDS